VPTTYQPVNLSRESLPKLGDRPHICSILATKTTGSCVGIFDDFAPPYPPGRFHAKTTIGPGWFHQLKFTLVIDFWGSYWLDFLQTVKGMVRVQYLL
jgi:hypothetical protein